MALKYFGTKIFGLFLEI